VTPAPTSWPVTYLTGSHNPDILRAAQRRGDIGLMVTPLIPTYIRVAAEYPVIGVDNGAFSENQEFCPKKFLALLRAVAADSEIKRRVRFAAAPDVVRRVDGKVFGDAKATLAKFERWADKINTLGLPVALVAQDGLEDMQDQILWDRIQVLFIGGSTEWKLGQFPRSEWRRESRWFDLFREAKKRNIPVHMGRVNSEERLEIAEYGLGCSTVDGTYIKFGPKRNQENLERWLNRENHRTDLDNTRVMANCWEEEREMARPHATRSDEEEWAQVMREFESARQCRSQLPLFAAA
jgi:hypothetical protein